MLTFAQDRNEQNLVAMNWLRFAVKRKVNII